jgi:glycosyltransferase involved in cell wall biosynthesis
MLFKFLKYITPTNYFCLERNNGTTIFPEYNLLPEAIKKQITFDRSYKTKVYSELDASWQAVQKGYIGKTTTLSFTKKIEVEDEYHFLRKNYNKLWVNYTLLVRLLTFHNPIKEISAFIKSSHVKRENIYKTPITYTKWTEFQSSLLQEKPLVSVIIPTLNRYDYLKDVLSDLEKQDYHNFDVIVIDQSEPFQEDFYNEFKLNLNVIHQQEKALWLARNTAIKKSTSNYLLLFDDDSRIENNWISNHLKCIDFFKAAISSGTSISAVGAKVPETYRYFKLSDQIDTGNVMIKREVFAKVGLFDKQFEKQRMGDAEFGLRAYLAGFLNISNPKSERLHLKVGTGGLRQMGSWDGFRPKKWIAPRPIPSVVYLFRNYFGNKLTRFALLKAVPPSLIPYKYKGSASMMLLGYLLSIILFPLVLFQVYTSWKLASIKLREGAKIEKI